MSRSNLVFAAILLVVLGVAAYVFYAPYLAMHRLQRAARSGDAVALDQSVDFVALRQNIKDQLDQRIESSVAQKRGSALASVASAFGAVLVNPMVDLLVTPQAIAAMVNGAKLVPTSHATDSDPPAISTTGTAPAPPTTGAPAGKSEQGRHFIAGYVNVSRFQIAPSKDGVHPDAPRLILERRGLDWKLTAIDLGFTPP